MITVKAFSFHFLVAGDTGCLYKNDIVCVHTTLWVYQKSLEDEDECIFWDVHQERGLSHSQSTLVETQKRPMTWGINTLSTKGRGAALSKRIWLNFHN